MRAPAALLLAAMLLPLPAARAGEVVEKAPDGTVLARYAVDDQGKRNGAALEYWPGGETKVKAWYQAGALEGAFQAFHVNGKVRVHAVFKAGVLQGDYTESDEQGRPTLVTAYRAGKIHGKLEAFVQGKRTSTQEWKDGRAITVDGVTPYPRDLETMRSAVETILAGRKPGESGAAPAPPPSDGEEGLRRLKAYRYLCEVPHEDLALRDDLNVLTDAAARVCERLGGITHTPKNPGLPEEEFKVAERGCGGSNLYGGPGSRTARSADSVDGYMDDSDARNIDRVGHRRWCLNPRMLFTGFGVSGGYAAMWSLDRSRGKVPEYEAVAYPPRGWCFRELFGPRHAWSLSLHTEKFSLPSVRARAAIYPVDDLYLRPAEPVPLDFHKVTHDGAGTPWCIIFRPREIDTSPGKRYWVEVTGLEKRKGPAVLHYLVEFADLREAGK